MKRIILLLFASAVASCGQAEREQAPAKPSAAKPKPAYCFFKQKDVSGWKVRRASSGNVVVSGRLYRQDPRYMAVFGKVEVSGSTATVWPTVTINTGKFAAPDDIWSATTTIPDSAAVTNVKVRCGAATFANLTLPPAV